MSPDQSSATPADSLRPDILTCGSCSKEFPLGHITSFIAHKVTGCWEKTSLASQSSHDQDHRTHPTSFSCLSMHSSSQEIPQHVQQKPTMVPCTLWQQDLPPPAHSNSKHHQFFSPRLSCNSSRPELGTAQSGHDQPTDLSFTCSEGFEDAKSGSRIVNTSLGVPTENKQPNRTILNAYFPKKRKISLSSQDSGESLSFSDRRHSEEKEAAVTTTSTNTSFKFNNVTTVLKEDSKVNSTAPLLFAKFPEKHEKLKQLLENKEILLNSTTSNLPEQKSSTVLPVSSSSSMAQQPNHIHFNPQIGSACDKQNNCNESYTFYPTTYIEAMKENVNGLLFNKARIACPKSCTADESDTEHLHKSSGILTIPDLNNTESFNSNTSTKNRKLGHFLNLPLHQINLIDQPASSFTYALNSCRKQNESKSPNCGSNPFYIEESDQCFDSNNSQNLSLTEKLTETWDIPNSKQRAKSFQDVIMWGMDPPAPLGPRVRSLPSYSKLEDDLSGLGLLRDFSNPPPLLGDFKSGWKYTGSAHGEELRDCTESPSLVNSSLQKTNSEKPLRLSHPEFDVLKTEKVIRSSATRSGISARLPPEPTDLPPTPDPENPEERGSSQQSSCSRETRANKKRRYPTSRPFKCDSCDQAFNQRIHLKKHMSKHTGVKPFQCQQCGYSTVERSHLKVHFRIHTGEKPYRCLFCDYATAQNSTLKIHLKRHHEWQPACQLRPSLHSQWRHRQTRGTEPRDPESDSSESLHSWSDLNAHRASVDTMAKLKYPGRNLKRSSSASDAPSGRLLALTHPFLRDRRTSTPKLKSPDRPISETEDAFVSVSKLPFLYESDITKRKAYNSHLYNLGQGHQIHNLKVRQMPRHHDSSESPINTRETEQVKLLGHKKESDVAIKSSVSADQYLALKGKYIANAIKDEETTNFERVQCGKIFESNFEDTSLLKTEEQINHRATKYLDPKVEQPHNSSQGCCSNEINDYTIAALNAVESRVQKGITGEGLSHKVDKKQMKEKPEVVKNPKIVETAENEETAMKHAVRENKRDQMEMRYRHLVPVESDSECIPALVSITILSKEFVRG